MNTLSGWGVLVTRPAEQADGLCRLIEDAGGTALRLPLLVIEPIEPAVDGTSTDGVDWLVFVSVNAVRWGLPALMAATGDRGLPKVAAIGQATAEALAQRGVTVDLVPKEQFNSEAFVASPELADVAGQRFLIVRGEGGRELIADWLRQQSASVDYLEVYRRISPNPADADRILPRWRNGDVNLLTITSGDALRNLDRLLGPADRHLLERCATVVPSERLAESARAAGCRSVTVAAGAGDRAMFDAVIALARKFNSIHSKQGDTALVDDEKQLTSDAEQPPQATAEAGNGTAEPPAAKPPRKSHVGAWVGYLTLLVVILLAGGGYLIVQELRSKQEGLGGELNKGDQQMIELTRQIAGLQSELAALQTQFATIQSQVTTEDSKFEREIGEQGASFAEKLEAARTELTASVQHIQRQMNQTRGNLMVADAEYLLSVANQKLHLVGDVKAVLAMMEAADQRLLDSGDPATFKVREALAEEIALLKGISPPDLVGASAKLLVLESKVNELPLFLPHTDVTKEDRAAVPKVPESKDEGKGLIDSTLKDLESLVKIRHTDRPLEAILTPEEVAILHQVLLLKLEMSRAALLRGDEALFRSNIGSSRDWLKEHFDHDSEAVKGVSEDLAALQELKIQIPFPDVSKSLTLLRNIEKLRLESGKSGGTKAPEVQPATTPEAGAQP